MIELNSADAPSGRISKRSLKKKWVSSFETTPASGRSRVFLLRYKTTIHSLGLQLIQVFGFPILRMLTKGLVCVLLASWAVAQDYAQEDQAAGEQQLAPNYARQGYHQELYETARAEPYDFGFQSTDEFGTIMNRQESSDNNGAVRGSYGYTDPYGVFRHVDYVADEHGFRAEVKSNEPGMGTQSPANVQIYAEPPPAGVIVERPYYHPHPGHPQHQGGQRNPSPTSNIGANLQSKQVRPGSSTRNSATSNSRRVLRPAAYPYGPTSTYQQQGSSQQQGPPQQQGSSQYPSTVSSQYAAHSQYSQETTYPSRSQYLGNAGYGSQQPAGSASASSGQAPIVVKPYDGPRYRIGNPHVTDLTRAADKDESGSILLPTVVATGNGPTTLVKHIHTYPSN